MGSAANAVKHSAKEHNVEGMVFENVIIKKSSDVSGQDWFAYFAGSLVLEQGAHKGGVHPLGQQVMPVGLGGSGSGAPMHFVDGGLVGALDDHLVDADVGRAAGHPNEGLTDVFG